VNYIFSSEDQIDNFVNALNSNNADFVSTVTITLFQILNNDIAISNILLKQLLLSAGNTDKTDYLITRINSKFNYIQIVPVNKYRVFHYFMAIKILKKIISFSYDWKIWIKKIFFCILNSNQFNITGLYIFLNSLLGSIEEV
jgi:hypothetical protein